MVVGYAFVNDFGTNLLSSDWLVWGLLPTLKATIIFSKGSKAWLSVVYGIVNPLYFPLGLLIAMLASNHNCDFL